MIKCETIGISILAVSVLFILLSSFIQSIASDQILDALESGSNIPPNSQWNRSVNPDIENGRSFLNSIDIIGYSGSIAGLLILFICLIKRR